jgi:hypothetical protein
LNTDHFNAGPRSAPKLTGKAFAMSMPKDNFFIPKVVPQYLPHLLII